MSHGDNDGMTTGGAASSSVRGHGPDVNRDMPVDGNASSIHQDTEDVKIVKSRSERYGTVGDEDVGGDDVHKPKHTLGQRGSTTTMRSSSKSYDDSYTAAEEQAVLRKLDRRLTLFLTLLYLLSFLDRSNIGNARVAGMQTSLGISGKQFDLTLIAFYVTYITFEWMILLYRVVPPHMYIAACVFCYGLVACLQATVRNLTQLLVLRAALGIAEAAFGPGVPFYMTFFYRREELAWRVGVQISAAPLATSFASSLAWVIVKLSENGPLESWRALFLFEGFPSIIAAVAAYYVIPDSPSSIRWMSPRERKIAALRVQRDTVAPSSSSSSSRTSPGHKSTVKARLPVSELVSTLLDPKAWLPSLMFLSVNVSFASLPVFLPTIINDMQFSALTSQILAAPPYLFAFAFVLLVSRASDRIPDSRGLFLMGCAGLSCISYSVIAVTGLLSAKNVLSGTGTLSILLRYLAVYGAAMGLFSSVVLIMTWQLNNQRSTAGRGMAMTILQVVGQCGPFIGVQLFPDADKPFFVKGMGICAGFMGLVAVLASALRLWLWRLNRDEVDPKVGRGRYEIVSTRGEQQEEGEGEEARGLVEDGDEEYDEDEDNEEEDSIRRRAKVDDQVFRYML